MAACSRHRVKERGSGKQFDCAEAQSLLLAVAHRQPGLIKVGCRGGGCGVCKIRVLEGEYVTKAMSKAQLSVQARQAGYVLACRAYPRSDLLFELVDQSQGNGVNDTEINKT